MPSSTEASALPVTFKGSRLATALLRLLGWRLDFAGFPTPQGVAVVYPHTSNWDFVVGMLAKWALGIPANYLAKDSLFRIPLLGRWMRWVGGIGIERSAAHGLVGQMTEVYAQAKATNHVLWLGVTPEGTRGLTPGWRTGFYQMALAAQVPLALVKFDWGRKRISIEDFSGPPVMCSVTSNTLRRSMKGSKAAEPIWLVRSSPGVRGPTRLKPAKEQQHEQPLF